eukprot:2732109-Pleurochrysis_carterae.AAC.1
MGSARTSSGGLGGTPDWRTASSFRYGSGIKSSTEMTCTTDAAKRKRGKKRWNAVDKGQLACGMQSRSRRGCVRRSCAIASA